MISKYVLETWNRNKLKENNVSCWSYYIIYLLTAIGLTPDAAVQYTFTHKQYTEQHNNTVIQNIQNITYITIIIHKNNIKNT
jgi:hypothetical protein